MSERNIEQFLTQEEINLLVSGIDSGVHYEPNDTGTSENKNSQEINYGTNRLSQDELNDLINEINNPKKDIIEETNFGRIGQ